MRLLINGIVVGIVFQLTKLWVLPIASDFFDKLWTAQILSCLRLFYFLRLYLGNAGGFSYQQQFP